MGGVGLASAAHVGLFVRETLGAAAGDDDGAPSPGRGGLLQPAGTLGAAAGVAAGDDDAPLRPASETAGDDAAARATPS